MDFAILYENGGEAALALPEDAAIAYVRMLHETDLRLTAALGAPWYCFSDEVLAGLAGQRNRLRARARRVRNNDHAQVGRRAQRATYLQSEGTNYTG